MVTAIETERYVQTSLARHFIILHFTEKLRSQIWHAIPNVRNLYWVSLVLIL
jgi:hypothetical protein